jgi:dTDP-4-dehydrorhamnose reductase
MRILVIGSTGQLGWELQRSLVSLGTIIAVDYPELDLVRPDSIVDCINTNAPDLILNAAAYTAVDQAEKEPDLAGAINGLAPGILAEQALKRESVLIHFSTDFVFDGQKGSPYRESDTPAPINIYGKTKLAGERAVQEVGGEYYIFRTSWLYSNRRPCFVSKVLDWARTQDTLRIVSDQIGSPTWARTLAQATAQAVGRIINRDKSWRRTTSGIYHTAGIGSASRFEWAQQILALDPHPEEHIVTQLQKASSADFKTMAERPAYSVLDCSRFQNTFDAFYVSWNEALEQALSASESR